MRPSSSVELWWTGRRLARFTVNGPGRYAQRISLPPKRGRGPYRLVLRSDLLRAELARALQPRPFEVVSEDGWLEQRDTLRLPAGWKMVEMTFMLPAESEDGIRLTFDYRGESFEKWEYDQPGTYRRLLRLPARALSDDGDIELDFTSTAALPPQPGRGETRRLAMRIQQIVDLTPGDGGALS